MRKALSITTLGLSGLVLDGDSKQQRGAKATPKRKSARKQPKAKARATQAAPTTQAARTTAKKPAAKPKRAKSGAARRPKRQPAIAATAAKPPAATAAAPPPATAARPGTPNGTVIALERIAKLHAQGALSDHEFAAAKARILGISSTSPAPERAPGTFPAIEANVAASRRLDGLAEQDRDAAGAAFRSD